MTVLTCAFCAAAALVTAGCEKDHPKSPSAHGGAEARIADLDARLAALEQTNAALRAERQAQAAELDRARAALKEAQDRLAPLERTNAALRAEQQAHAAELDKARAAQKEAQDRLAPVTAERDRLQAERRAEGTRRAELDGQLATLGQEARSARDDANRARDEAVAAKSEAAAAKREAEIARREAATLRAERDQARTRAEQAGAPEPAPTRIRKGRLVKVDGMLMFAAVELTEEARKALPPPDKDGMLQPLELGLRRPGLRGPAGDFVGRICLRQAIAGTNLVRADILDGWQQVPAQVDDEVFSE